MKNTVIITFLSLIVETSVSSCGDESTDRMEAFYSESVGLQSVSLDSIMSFSKKVDKYAEAFPSVIEHKRYPQIMENIRISTAGNTAKDTQGCILVGKNKIVGMVLNSRLTLTKVRNLLRSKNLELRIKS